MGLVGKWIWAFVLTALCVASASAQVHVKGYYRKDGTYVAPYVRSAPNATRSDNYSTRGNVNPYTGEAGTQSLYPSTAYELRRSYAPRDSISARASSAQVAPGVSMWRCVDAQGTRSYLSYPRAGCDEIIIPLRPDRSISAHAIEVDARRSGQPDERALLEHGHYINSSDHVVHRPAHTVDNQAPNGASARCRDGSFSFSEHRRGTCSHHGGVAEWL